MGLVETFAVFMGGGIGAVLRYLFSVLARHKFGITYWATFLINVLGCVFLGAIMGLSLQQPNLIPLNLKFFLATGIAGGFTTFSTFSQENIDLLKSGKTYTSLAYIFSSLICGFAGIYAGFELINLINLH